MVKITVKEEGKKAKILESDSFFVWTDKGAMWKGVDTHIAKVLEIHAELIIKKFKESILNANTK